MNLVIWLPVLLMVAIATVTDIKWRRIPNWLTLPLLIAGIAVNTAFDGELGLIRSLAGFGVAVLILALPCWLDTLGWGDLKLMAAIGAWVGLSELLFIALITAMAGGVLAIGYAMTKRQMGTMLDRTAALLTAAPWRRGEPLFSQGVSDPEALAIPYAPAIAIGVLFTFLAS